MRVSSRRTAFHGESVYSLPSPRIFPYVAMLALFYRPTSPEGVESVVSENDDRYNEETRRVSDPLIIVFKVLADRAMLLNTVVFLTADYKNVG